MTTFIDPPPNAAGQAWPVLDDAALYGLPGDIVDFFDPETEADPVAILSTALQYFGTMAINYDGIAPYAIADSAQHPARLNVLLAGMTARSRKGTSRENVERLFYRANPDFIENRMKNGFVSGEALIETLATIENDVCSGVKVGDGSAHEQEEDDSEDEWTLPDHRMHIVEPEFSRLLAAASWQGSTISSVIRQAWDGGHSLELRARKHKPLIAKNPHISILGHITIEELKARITETDLFSGFLNRFIIICVHRSKILPSGGDLDASELDRLARRINRTLMAVRHFEVITRTRQAEDLWRDIYHEIAEDDPGGILGAATARAEAQLLRLSVTYALMACSPKIKVAHLEAAWALWSYSRASSAYIFGRGNVADTIFTALVRAGKDGLSRSEISALLGHHRTRREIDAALQVLVREQLIEKFTVQGRSGRPQTRLRLKRNAAAA